MGSKATGYSDYYKNNDQTPLENTDTTDSNSEDSMVAKRKAALRRRLLSRKKAGM